MAGFALDSSGGVVMQDANTPQAGPATQITGGGGAATGGGTPTLRAPGGDFAGMATQGMATFNALNKLTEGALQPLIEEQKKTQYFQGMAEVAQGKSLIDVKNQTPAWLQIFGPSATTQGAQQMTSISAMNQAQTDFMSAMPQLRTQSPDQVRSYLVQQASKIGSTGDPQTDAMVQAKLAEQFGPMLDTHMKQHLQYVQEQNMLGFSNMQVSSGDTFQSTMAAQRSTPDPVSMEGARQQAAEAWVQPPGMTDEAWSKTAVQSAQANLQRGNFAWFNAFQNSPEYQKIPIEARTQLAQQLPLYVQQNALTNPDTSNLFTSRDGLSFNLTHGMSGIPSSPDGYKQLDSVIDGINTAATTTNGSTVPFINNQMRAKMREQLDTGNLAAQAKLAKAHLAQDNYNQSGEIALNVLNTGNYGMAHGLNLNAQAVGQQMDTVFSAAVQSGDPDIQQTAFNKLAAVSYDDKFKSPQLAQEMTTQLNALVSGNGPATPKMQEALSHAQMLMHSPAGAAALQNYAGEATPKVIAMIQSGIDTSDPLQLTQQRELIARGGAAVATKEDRDAATKAVADANPGFIKQMIPFFGGAGSMTPFGLTADAQSALAKQVGPQIAQYATAYNMDAKTAAPIVIGRFLKNADMVPGSFVPHNPSVSGDTSFASAVNQIVPGMGNQGTSLYQTTMQEAINDALKEKVAKGGGEMGNFDASNYQVQTGEQLGNGMLMLWMSPKKPDGTMTPIILRANDFATRIKSNFGKPAFSGSRAPDTATPDGTEVPNPTF